MRALFRLLAVAALLVLTAGPHVLAQGDNPLVRPPVQPGAKNPFSWLFGGGREEKKATAPARRNYEPRRRTASAPRPQPTTTAPDGTPLAPGTEAAAPAAPPPVALNILVVGDSLAGMLAQGLKETYADRPGIVIHARSRDSSGLVRDDYYNWPKVLRDTLSGAEKFDAVLMMIGSNDRQALKDDQGSYEPRSERWRELYMARIDAIIDIVREKGLPLHWVGMPVMRAERYSGDMLAFNDIYRARAQNAGIAYIDIWEAFGADQGEYVVSGPDVSGEIVRLRTGDGVHFTKAGARKLAFFADKSLQKLIEGAQARQEVAATMTPVLPSPVAPGGPLTLPPPPEAAPPLPRALRTNDALLGIALPDVAARSSLQPRPLSGPATALNLATTSPGGVLLEGAPPARRTGDAEALFVEGRLPQTKPGRADDFRR